MKQSENLPKYLAIKNNVLEKISRGEYKPGDRIPSELELSEQYAVSTITSRRALNELEQDGYIIRVKGSGSYVKDYSLKLKQSKNRMIAMVLPFSVNTGGSMKLLKGVESVAKKYSYYVSIENTHASRLKEREIILNVIRDNIAGIIYYPAYTSENFDLIKKLVLENYPIVIIDKMIYDIKTDNVLIDNYGASYAMTELLIAEGHRQIAFVSRTFIDSRSSLRERFLGYCDALAENNLTINLDHVFYMKTDREVLEPDNEIDLFYEQIMDFVCSRKVITALQVAADIDAVTLVNLARKKGLRVPEDISVVGFDDLEIALYVRPPLTTIRQNFETIGEQAAQMIIDRIDHPNKAPERKLIPAELILRKTHKKV